MQSVCTLSVPSQYLSVLIRSRVQGPCVTSKSTVSASALGLAIYAAAHALLEENLSPPRLASTRLPAGMVARGWSRSDRAPFPSSGAACSKSQHPQAARSTSPPSAVQQRHAPENFMNSPTTITTTSQRRAVSQ